MTLKYKKIPVGATKLCPRNMLYEIQLHCSFNLWVVACCSRRVGSPNNVLENMKMTLTKETPNFCVLKQGQREISYSPMSLQRDLNCVCLKYQPRSQFPLLLVPGKRENSGTETQERSLETRFSDVLVFYFQSTYDRNYHFFF